MLNVSRVKPFTININRMRSVRFGAVPTVDPDILQQSFKALQAAQNPNTRMAAVELVFLASDHKSQGPELQAKFAEMNLALDQAKTPLDTIDKQNISTAQAELHKLCDNPANQILWREIERQVFGAVLQTVFTKESEPAVKTRANQLNQSFMQLVRPQWNFKYSL